MSNSIKVVARFRPQNRTEIGLGGLPIVDFESDDTCRLDVCFQMWSHNIKSNSRCSPRRHLAPLHLTACLI